MRLISNISHCLFYLYIYIFFCNIYKNLFVRLDIKKMEVRLDDRYCIQDCRLGYVDLV